MLNIVSRTMKKTRPLLILAVAQEHTTVLILIMDTLPCVLVGKFIAQIHQMASYKRTKISVRITTSCGSCQLGMREMVLITVGGKFGGIFCFEQVTY